MPGVKPSWTAKLLADPQLLCKKVREEAGELCQTLEADEGKERAASEAADLFYHAMVLLNKQVRPGAGGGVGWQQGVSAIAAALLGGEQVLPGGRSPYAAVLVLLCCLAVPAPLACHACPYMYWACTLAQASQANACTPHCRAGPAASMPLVATLPKLNALCFCRPLPQGVSLEDVSRVLRSRFGTSGIEEKAARPPKQ